LWEYLGNLLEESDGEISEAFEAELKRLEASTQDCLSSLLYLIRKSEREAAAYKLEQAHFAAKAKRKEAQVDYFRSLMRALMESSGMDKFGSTLGTATLAKPTGTRLSVPDVMNLPSDYRESVLTWKPMTKLIDEAFARGFKVPGVVEIPREPYLTVRLL
jgi:hypothetical protein